MTFQIEMYEYSNCFSIDIYEFLLWETRILDDYYYSVMYTYEARN